MHVIINNIHYYQRLGYSMIILFIEWPPSNVDVRSGLLCLLMSNVGYSASLQNNRFTIQNCVCIYIYIYIYMRFSFTFTNYYFVYTQGKSLYINVQFIYICDTYRLIRANMHSHCHSVYHYNNDYYNNICI